MSLKQDIKEVKDQEVINAERIDLLWKRLDEDAKEILATEIRRDAQIMNLESDIGNLKLELHGEDTPVSEVPRGSIDQGMLVDRVAEMIEKWQEDLEKNPYIFAEQVIKTIMEEVYGEVTKSDYYHQTFPQEVNYGTDEGD